MVRDLILTFVFVFGLLMFGLLIISFWDWKKGR